MLRLDRYAQDETALILLQGESGTGKTTLARRVHLSSPRRKGPFHHVVLSTLDDGLAGSELFGHVVGAFTDARSSRPGHFVSASGGTLFLDEIGKASMPVQGKLLHAIEYSEIRPVGSDRTIHVDVRIVAATNVDLGELVKQNKFQPDLLGRLETFRINLPPLRERRADIPALVNESLRRHAKAAGYTNGPPDIAPDLMAALRGARWPRNLRELDGTMHCLLLEAEGAPCLTLGHCTGELSFLVNGLRDRRTITRIEIEQAIAQTRNKTEAAARLGIDRKTLRNIQKKGD